MARLLAILTGMLTLLITTFSSVSSATTTSFQLHSELLNETFTIRVAVPESYLHSTDFEYPLLLVMDGSTQFNHIAGNVEFMSTFAEIPDMVVVGVSANNRLFNFTPTEVDRFGRSGGASRYTEFLVSELMPKVREDYRIARYTTVSGHSLSGLYTTYLALHHADNFQAAISISPSLWWDDFGILSEFEQLTTEPPGVRWFVSMANEPDEMAEAFERLKSQLDKLSASHLTYKLHHFDDETHDSTPLIGNVMGLRSIFQEFNAVPEIDVMSLEQLEGYYQAYGPVSNYTLPMGVHQYNVYGLKAAYHDQLLWGIEIIEAGVEQFPHSEILWDSLASVYQMNDDLPAALEASKKAVEYAHKHGSKYLAEIVAQNERLTSEARE